MLKMGDKIGKIHNTSFMHNEYHTEYTKSHV
jgi:hypothetical protein